MSNVITHSEIENFDLVIERKAAKVYLNSKHKVIICKLLLDYIPIDEFKAVFHEISDLVKDGGFEKFIFDKRSLRAFHQPTMEWYFIHWKKDMLAFGITKHRKILPEEKWFEKMVQIAKAQILANYPDNIIDQLDIRYCDSIEDAIAQ